MATKKKTLTPEEKAAMAKSLGTGGANKAASAMMNRQAQMDAAMEEAVGEVQKKKTAQRSAY